MLHSLIQAIAKVLIVPTIFLMGLAGYNTHVLSPDMAQQESQYLQSSQLYGGTQPFAGGAYNLAGSGVSSNASTVILTSLTIKQTGQLIQTSDLVGTGGTFYVTLEPGSNTRQEIIGCTGVSQNGASASLTNCSRGLSPVSPYTASTTLQFTHGGGTQVIFSDPPQLFNQYAALANANTFTAIQTFTAGANPTYTANPSSFAPNDLVNYQTLINTSISGAATSSETNMGISQLATLAQLNANTASSSQGRPLVVPNKLGTSTCQVTGGAFLVSSSTTGKLGGNCFDQTYSYSPTGIWNFLSNLGIGTTSPYAPLSVVGVGGIVAGKFNATSTASSTVVNITASNNASTTNLTVSNKTILSTIPGDVITATVSTSTTFTAGTVAATTVSGTAYCVAPLVVSGGGYSGFIAANVAAVGNYPSASYPSASNAWTVTAACNTNGTCTASTITVYALCVNP